jgi:hypothetical protein
MFAARTIPVQPTIPPVRPGPKPKSRAPVMYNKIRGSFPTAPITEQERGLLTHELEEDMTVEETRRVRDSYWRTWSLYHGRWFGDDDPVLPMTHASIIAVAAQMKHYGYRSYPNYLSAARERHVNAGHDWTGELDRIRLKCVASTQRGIGPARQSIELCPHRIAALNLGPESLADEGPICPGQWAVLCSFHMLRGAESACALAQSLVVDCDDLREYLLLPASKTDPQGVGCRRCWGCVCKRTPALQDARQACPYHAALFIKQELTRRFGGRSKTLPPDLPLFPTTAGGWCTRAGFVKTIAHLADSLQVSTIDTLGRGTVGEHVWRVSGSRMLAYANLPVPVIMLMARWGSEVIMRYIAEAPLRTITAVYIAGSAGSSADTLSIKDDWGEAVGPSTTEGLPAHAIEDAEELLEPPPARSATDKFALNLTRNHLHVIAARECWEKVYPGRTRCGRDYKNSEWSTLSSVVEFHEKGGREHMVFKCHKCAKPPEWAELCTDSTVLSDSD